MSKEYTGTELEENSVFRSELLEVLDQIANSLREIANKHGVD